MRRRRRRARGAVDEIAALAQDFHCCRIASEDFAKLDEKPERPCPVCGTVLPFEAGVCTVCGNEVRIRYDETKETYRRGAREALEAATVLRLGPFRLVRA